MRQIYPQSMGFASIILPADTQAIGRSRGGRTTKIHAVADLVRRLIAFDITPGQRGDIRPAAALLATLPKPDYVLADTAYDGDRLRQSVQARGATAVIKQTRHARMFRPSIKPFT